MIGVEVFSGAGFHAVEGGDAEEALELLEALATVHLLFTDIHTPGAMDGLALAHHAARQWRHIGVIIVSGQGEPHPDSLPTGSRFLAKPYNPERVLRHARELTGL
jgi:two-component system, response regulator PdtaR